MTPIQLIELHKDDFTKSEIIIMNYLLNHLDEISSQPINITAKNCKVSKSALLRFCQKCGFRGYSEFKYEVSRHMQSITEITENESNKKQAIIKLYTDALIQLPLTLDNNKLNQLSEYIINARKIKIFGVHETGLSAKYFGYRLCSIGIDSESVVNTDIFTEKALMSNKDDLNIFLSLSAETGIVKDAIKSALDSNCTNVIITQNDHHKFKNKIDLELLLPTFKLEKKEAFVDSQAIVLISIDLIINNIASNLRKAK